MKLAITGKGGVGKTTLASTLARLYADEGRPVLAADVDPDANLGLALGMSQEEVDSIVPISKMRTLVEERTGANEANKFFKLNPFVSDIPEKYAHEVNGVKLLVMGTVDVGGSGCVCPEHVMLKALLSALTYRKDDVVIMDMEAGLEHLGRGLDEIVGPFLVGDTPQERDDLVVHAPFGHFALACGEPHGIVYRHDLVGRDAVAVDDDVAREVRNGDHPVCGMHACTFDGVDLRVDVLAAAVVFRGVHMHDQRLARYALSLLTHQVQLEH